MKKTASVVANSVRFKEFATFLPTILSTLFRWLVTVRNFPTPCKIQGNCNPFFFTHIPNPKIQGICNFLAHNSQLVQARAHALREPIPSYPRQTQSPRESKHVPMHWESQSQVTQGRLNHQGKASTCPCIEREPISSYPRQTQSPRESNTKQHQTVEVWRGIIDDDKCALTPASSSSRYLRPESPKPDAWLNAISKLIKHLLHVNK
jgi:hypothetical protein